MSDTTSSSDIAAWFAQVAACNKGRAKAGLLSGPKKACAYLGRFNSIPRRSTKIINARYEERCFYLGRALDDLAADRRARGLVRRTPVRFKEWVRSFGDIWIAGRTTGDQKELVHLNPRLRTIPDAHP